MGSGSFFGQNRFGQTRLGKARLIQTHLIQTHEDALRHIDLLTKGLKKLAWAGLAGGTGCGVLALLVGHFLAPHNAQSAAIPGTRELTGVLLVAWFMATALLGFSILYLIAAWGLSHQKSWARYAAAGVFLAKVLLCVWLGRGSIAAMMVFLLFASWDLYGLWVLLSKQTGHLFTSSQVSGKPASRPAA